MNLETTSAAIGRAIEAHNQIVVAAVRGVTSTDTFKPPGVAGPDAQNPEPATGFVKAFSDKSERRPVVAQATTEFLHQQEVIIGSDDRVRVTNPAAWPNSVHGHLVITFPNNKVYIGSGTMISRHHVLTAGHCVYSKADGGWATSILFNAAQNESNLPFGSVSASRLLSVSGWTNNNDSAYDMGMLILQSDLGNATGWFGIITFPNDNDLLHKRVNVTGYPGDKGGEQMWTHADAVKSVTAENAYYDIDTLGGQSGSGVWSTFTGHTGEKVASIHTTGASTGNGSTRLSRPKFDRILDWLQNY